MRIQVKNLRKSYIENEFVLDKLDFLMEDKEKIIITGKSGVGKTTFLKIISLIDTKYDGKLYINEKNVKNFSKADLQKYRKNISYVFQEYALLEDESVYNNVGISISFNEKSDEENYQNIYNILRILKIEKFIDRKVRTLSGGQRQRVALARALVKDSQLLIADEPFSSLDIEMINDIVNWLKINFKDRNFIFSFHEKPSYFEKEVKVYKIEDLKMIE